MGSFLFGIATFQLISGWSYPRDNPRSCGIHDFLAWGVRLWLRWQGDRKIPGIHFQLCLHGSPQVVDPVDGTRGEGDYGTPGIHSCRSRTDEELGFQTPFSNSPIPCWELPDPIPSSRRVEFQRSSARGPARHFHFLGTAHPIRCQTSPSSQSPRIPKTEAEQVSILPLTIHTEYSHQLLSGSFSLKSIPLLEPHRPLGVMPEGLNPGILSQRAGPVFPLPSPRFSHSFED